MLDAPVTSGKVYLMRNPEMPNCVKIGFTTIDPRDRAGQLSSATGVPAPFEVIEAFETDWPRDVESRVHTMLDYCRVAHNKEFFSADIENCIHIATSSEFNQYFCMLIRHAVEYVDTYKQWERTRQQLAQLTLQHESELQAYLWECIKKNNPDRAAAAQERLRTQVKSGAS